MSAVVTVTDGKATLTGTVTANGTAGDAYFQYGTGTVPGNLYELGDTTPVFKVLAGDNGRPITANLTGLTDSKTYHYRLVFKFNGVVAPVTSDARTNHAPVAVADTLKLPMPTIGKIDVVKNDTDLDAGDT